MESSVRVRVKWDEFDYYLGRNPEMHRIPDEQAFPAFANPYHISPHRSREQVVQMYDAYIRDRIKREPHLKQELRKLKGKRLACWCGKDQQCHVDVVLRLIREYWP